ncbi:MAG: phosphatidate cytidylyltransferase [Faecousia sp.]
MKTRIIAAAVLLPILAIALFWLPLIVTAIIFALLSAIAAYELLWGTGLCRHPRLVIYSMVMAFIVPVFYFCSIQYEMVNTNAYILLGAMAFFALLFGEMMASHVKLRFEYIAYCFVAGLLIPFLFSSIVRIHAGYAGRYYVVIPFVLAFASDTGAYFTGKFFGRNKLAPVISPNKTIEGVIGGIGGAVVCMLLYCLLMKLAFNFNEIHYGYALVYGVAGSLTGVFGDLCFSVIKRQTGIKDYGKLIPGHGGVLDRFDSMILVAPLTEALLILIRVVN